MAKAYATCTCAHCGAEFVVTATRSSRKEADSWEKWAATHYDCCDECAAKMRAEENARCAAAAVEMGLPALKGSVKQIAWAEKIRMDFVAKVDKAFDKLLERYEKQKAEDKVDEFIESDIKAIDITRKYTLEHSTSAAWWIDRRSSDFRITLNDVYTEHKAEIDELIERGAAQVAEPEPVPETDTSVTVMPETVSKDVAKITVTEDGHLHAAYPVKDDAFRAVCKAYGMQWDPDNRVWARKLGITAGDPVDRQADLANRLLREGFPVRCETQAIADKAVAADFAPERTRWIYRATKNKTLLIWDAETEDEFYAALRLPGAKCKEYYSKRAGKYGEVTAPVHLYAAVKEYAEMYDYELTPAAEEAIEKFEADKVVVRVATPAAPAQPDPEAKLKAILDSSDDVLPDLEDDTDETDH